MGLADSFMPALAYVACLLRSETPPPAPYEQVKGDVLRLLAQGEEEAKRGVYSKEEFDLARLAVVAWIDEAVLNSSWPHRERWQKEQLQRIFYRTTEAGEAFFEKLNGLGLNQKGLREVYYICLALGFMGRYCHPGDEVILEHLRASNLKLLLGDSGGIPSFTETEIFPEAYPVEEETGGPARGRFRFTPLKWVLAAGPVFLFGVFFLLFRLVLRGAGENFLALVP